MTFLSKEKVKKVSIENMVKLLKDNLCLLATALYISDNDLVTKKVLINLNHNERTLLNKHLKNIKKGLYSENDLKFFDIFLNILL